MDIASAFQSFNTARDIVKRLMELRDYADDQGLLIQLQGAVISAQETTVSVQSENTALIKQKDDLEQELVRFKTWETEKQRYELTEIAPGTVAYVAKESMRGSEPVHWLCPHCYQDRRKGFFQFDRRIAEARVHACQTCKSEIKIPVAPRDIPLAPLPATGAYT